MYACFTVCHRSLSGESQSSRFTGISFQKNFNENFQNKIQLKEIVTECQNYFSLHTVGELIKKRKLQFLQKIVSSLNTVICVYLLLLRGKASCWLRILEILVHCIELLSAVVH